MARFKAKHLFLNSQIATESSVRIAYYNNGAVEIEVARHPSEQESHLNHKGKEREVCDYR